MEIEFMSEIEDAIKRVINDFESRATSAILGTTYTDEPQDPPLTYDRLLEMFLSVPKAPPPLKIFEVPLYAVKVQARRHPRKKRRLQKKWLTRYGYRTEYRRHFEPGQMLVDKERGVVYAHGEEVAAVNLPRPERAEASIA
jgi:hypothetical protein